uniref:Putative pdz-domain-containing protein n=1 Tax=Lutzomyia longipalpis TaxID=7200 RepID=A0A1B0GIU3_LUTLO
MATSPHPSAVSDTLSSISTSNKMATSPRSAPDTISVCSTVSALSSCPDRHGFYGGVQFTDKPKAPLPRSQILAREKKWLHMMDIWREYMAKNYKKVRERCRKGIPASVRPRAWFYLSGAHLLHEKYPNLYEELLKMPGNQQYIEEIRKDQHRQFPFHEMFLDEEKPGYLKDYFKPGMEMLQRDAGMLMALVKKTSPNVYRHLQKHKVEPLLFMTDWFLCAMTRTLPWDTLLRVWDCFLCEGIKILFKVALVILGASLGPRSIRKVCNDLCETLEVLRSPPEKVLEENFMMHHVLNLNLSREDFEREHQRQAELRRRGKSS